MRLSAFRTIECDAVQEAAALIAALSRVLASPRGAPYRAQDTPLEVLAHVGADGVTVFLSESAFAAAAEAFSPVPVAGTIQAEDVPPSSVSLIRGSSLVAWGLDDVHRRLTSR